MKHKALLLLIPTLLLASCSSQSTSTGPSNNENQNTSSSSSQVENNPNSPHYNGNYYSSIDANATGAALLSQVRDLTVSKHTHYTYYGDNRGKDGGGKYHQTDYDPKNPSRLIMFYTHDSTAAKWAGGSTYNREHVWPKSLSSGNWDTNDGGADMHHIRPAYKDINSKRGNLLYGDARKAGQVDHNGKPAGYINGVFEPMDFAKGDVARIILYTFIHYNNPSNLSKLDNLNDNLTSTASSQGSSRSMPITNVIAANNYKEAFDLLIEWNRIDPVDELEMNRNNGVEKIQHNRNPFIDHPEYIEKIWG